MDPFQNMLEGVVYFLANALVVLVLFAVTGFMAHIIWELLLIGWNAANTLL